MKKILILGDYNLKNHLHKKINESLELILKNTDLKFEYNWINTDAFQKNMLAEEYNGLWVAPGSPYKSMENVLTAIHFARTNQIPTLGTCAGFQHMLIEYAKNVCQLNSADHEETNSQSPDLIISKLSCSLVGQKENLTITDKTSKIYQLLKKDKFEGEYHCNYGFNSNYYTTLQNNGCKFTVFSEDNQVRAFEIEDHPFFIGTLFQTQLLKPDDQTNPIIQGFIKTILK